MVHLTLGSDPLAVPFTVPRPVVAPALDSNDRKLHLTLAATLDATASDLAISSEVSADFQTSNTGAGYVEVISDSTTGTVRTLSLRDSTPLGATAQHYLRLPCHQAVARIRASSTLIYLLTGHPPTQRIRHGLRQSNEKLLLYIARGHSGLFTGIGPNTRGSATDKRRNASSGQGDSDGAPRRSAEQPPQPRNARRKHRRTTRS